MYNSSQQYFIQFVYPTMPKVRGKPNFFARGGDIIFPNFQIRDAAFDAIITRLIPGCCYLCAARTWYYLIAPEQPHAST